MIDSHILLLVVSLFMLILFGYIMKAAKVLDESATKVINGIITCLCMPCFLIMMAHDKPFNTDMVKVPFITLAVELVIIAVAYFLGKAMKLERATLGAFMLVCAFTNSGYIGYPLVISVFHHSREAILAAVILDQIITVIPISSIGIAIAVAFAGGKCTTKTFFTFLKSPMFWSGVLSLVLRNVYIPEFLTTTMNYMSGATIPLAMISIGLTLTPESLKGHVWAMALATFFKLFVYGTVTFFILRTCGYTGVVPNVAAVIASTPTGVLTAVVTGQYGGEQRFASAVVFITTLLSIITIPIVCGFVL